MTSVNRFLYVVGGYALSICSAVGVGTIFCYRCVVVLCTRKPSFKKVISYMNKIGVESLGIVILTGLFAGMVLALQTYIGFQRVGGEQFIGAVVALGLIRELGPVLTGLMVTGRAGSAIGAEIGTMRITEQIDALVTLHIDVFEYLIVPRLIAGIIMLPCLALFSMAFGIWGGYLVSTHVLGLSAEDFTTSVSTYVEINDIMGGVKKSAVFGAILTLVGSYCGYYTSGGARGVGIATTRSVVLGSIFILVSNYFLTKMLEHL